MQTCQTILSKCQFIFDRDRLDLKRWYLKNPFGLLSFPAEFNFRIISHTVNKEVLTATDATVSCVILGGRAAEAVAESDWRVRQLDGGGMPPKNAVNTVAEPDWSLFETIWMQLGVKLETEWNVGNNHVTFNRKKSGRSRNNCNATWLHCVIKLVCR